jgi:hypothetical protein
MRVEGWPPSARLLRTAHSLEFAQCPRGKDEEIDTHQGCRPGYATEQILGIINADRPVDVEPARSSALCSHKNEPHSGGVGLKPAGRDSGERPAGNWLRATAVSVH